MGSASDLGRRPVTSLDAHPEASRPELSVVIPSYNSAPWLPSTLAALAEALRRADVDAQVIVVDDGSSDDTQTVVDGLRHGFPGALQLVVQQNRGRFLARWHGLELALAADVLLLDSRVLLDPMSIGYVMSQVRETSSPRGWNAHVRTDERAPLVGLFWDVPTYIFWGSYLRDPRPFDLTVATFDRAPKGTGVFLAPASLMRDAFRQAWPEGDAHLVSDDTKVLRWIASTTSIRLDPGFSAVYRPRTTLRGFVRHTLDRGTLFVDSYAGTTPVRSAIILAGTIAPVAVLAGLVVLVTLGQGFAALIAGAVLVAAALLPVIPAAINRCPPRSIVAYVCLLPAFVVPFWLGLLRGVFIHRKVFRGRGQDKRPKPGEEIL